MFGDAYRGRRVVVTGHTGFKGSWLALWLTELGAKVTGIALDPPTSPSHWDLLRLSIEDRRADVRDADAISRAIAAARPEAVFHLAAQPLVRRSYAEPALTWETNVQGTVHVLEACRKVEGLAAVVVVTSDKCYENRGTGREHREDDPLGGADPYSASKAAAEMVAASYRHAFFTSPSTASLATVRAGNVIGGGDWAEDRLVPDAVRALQAQAGLRVRSPDAIRPWQHVLESLGGYLLLGARLLEGRRELGEAWNFGPVAGDHLTVSGVLGRLQRSWPGLKWEIDEGSRVHEAGVLRLDIAKAREKLGWRPVWTLDEALDATAAWYRACLDSGTVTSREQLRAYLQRARESGLAWTA